MYWSFKVLKKVLKKYTNIFFFFAIRAQTTRILEYNVDQSNRLKNNQIKEETY